MKCILIIICSISLLSLVSAASKDDQSLSDRHFDEVLSDAYEIETIMKPQLNEILQRQPAFKLFNTELDIDAEGETYDLKPMVIRPRLTLQQRVDRDYRENKMNFLTSKGLTKEYLKDLPSWDVDFLNRFTLPFFGMRPSVRAAIRARKMRDAKHLETIKMILSVKREYHPDEYLEQLERYREMMR